MSIIADPTTAVEKVVARFTRYLNGPMGKTVLDNLEDGESFILQTSEHTLRITKKHGRAVVTPLPFSLA